MLIVGERINASRSSIADALKCRDREFLQREAKAQDMAGADYIDLNAAIFGTEEVEYLKWLIDSVQAVTDKPLCIDSPNAAAIKSVMADIATKPMINSITLEPSRLERMLTLAAEYDTKVIALCQSDTLIAKTVDEKIDIAGKLVEKVSEAGIPLEDLYIDPLVFPLSADEKSSLATLEAIKGIMRSYAGVHTICGVSNVSYGLPNRKLVNRSFLIAGIAYGLDSVIVDPLNKELYAALKTAVMVAGKDDYCMEYITAFREGLLC